MATSTKLEFAVQMTCDACVESIRSKLAGKEGIHSVQIILDKEQVLVETSHSSKHVVDLIEDTGRRAVLMGMGSTAGKGHLGAAVAMMSGPSGVQGVARLVQVNTNTCVIDGTVDGLTPGPHGLYIHTLGDLSDGCTSCGEVFDIGTTPNDTKKYGDLGAIEASSQSRAEFRLETSRIKVWDIIGRSMVVHDKPAETSNRSACGILARSAGLFQNPKRICACDGVPVWDERDLPAAGGERLNYKTSRQGEPQNNAAAL